MGGFIITCSLYPLLHYNLQSYPTRLGLELGTSFMLSKDSLAKPFNQHYNFKRLTTITTFNTKKTALTQSLQNFCTLA